MARFRSSVLAFGAGMALIVVVLVISDLHQTVIAAVKETLVRDVDHAANYPYIGGLDTTFGAFPTVPTTTLDGKPVKRAVIEFVTGSCNSTLPATIYEVSLGVTLMLGPGSSQNAHYTFVPIPTTTAGGTNALSAFSQQVRLYADPGTALTAGIGINSGGGGGGGFSNCSMVFSGHLVTE
jgi:hypothetical protein